MLRRLIPWLATVPLFAVVSCTCGADPDDPPAVTEGDQRFLLCGRLVDDRQEEEVDAGTVRFKRRGFVLERQGETDGRARFGVVAGVEEWNEPNRSNLLELAAWFTEQQVEALFVVGGIGPDRETCHNVLEALAGTDLLILPLIGASADFAGYRRAVAQVRQSRKNVVDLTTARLIRWDGVDIVSLPGYHNPFYLAHRRGGCAYRDEDVEALRALVGDVSGPVLLVAASPPRGRGRDAVDRARGDVNIGDPRLAKLIRESGGKIAFGLFGHVYEAGGNASADVDGYRAVAPESWSKSLYVNPGAVEAVPYDLMSGGRSRGMGAIFEIGPEGARYRVKKLERMPTKASTLPQPEIRGQQQTLPDAGAGT